MKTSALIKLFLFTALTFSCLNVYGQSLPVGTPTLEDAYRRAQLVGSFDESVSFTLRPFYPSYINANGQSDSSALKEERILFKLLPLTLMQQYNSDHPEGLDDGSMIPARGYQTMFRGGVFANYRWLSIQFMPEFVYAENRAYQGLTDKHSDGIWQVYNNDILNYIDIPERFGKTSYKKAFWGQSSIRLTFDPISIGISNENLWWGPGMQNALLMTNNAPGFKHITINTVRPIRTFIGSFEGQLIGGRLDASGYPGIDSTRLSQHGITYFAKPHDWRYLSGLTLTYQPKWLPGLFLGAARSYIGYHQDFTGNFIDDYFPVLTTDVMKEMLGFNMNLATRTDELASVFIRWVMPKSHMEVYLEYGREDNCLDATDLLLELEYSDGYILGFRKLTPLKNHKDEFIDISAEISRLEKNVISWNRAYSAAGVWYIHGPVYDGYTHNGQYLGSGIGTSSNMQSLNISWVKKMKRVGLEFKRVAHEEDFWYFASRNPKNHWVDIGGAVIGEWDYKQFLINTKIQLVGSNNYQYLYSPGKITYNFHTELGITYLF